VFVDGPVDALDHASPLPHYGSKMGIDATRKWSEEGFTRDWPEVIAMTPDIIKKVDELWPRLGL
jgi:4-hydroxy-3-polyprenylbenzoate decarboxylase